MKLTGFEPAYPIVDKFGSATYSGLPIRLELAARVMAGLCSNFPNDIEDNPRNTAMWSLRYADALIADVCALREALIAFKTARTVSAVIAHEEQITQTLKESSARLKSIGVEP